VKATVPDGAEGTALTLRFAAATANISKPTASFIPNSAATYSGAEDGGIMPSKDDGHVKRCRRNWAYKHLVAVTLAVTTVVAGKCVMGAAF
jgi:hypothetical protein